MTLAQWHVLHLKSNEKKNDFERLTQKCRDDKKLEIFIVSFTKILIDKINLIINEILL
jgi:hypothetical protein